MVQNEIPRVFLFQEKVWNWTLRVFLFWEMVRNGIPRVFSSEKWFGTEFQGFFSSEQLFRTDSKIFLFRETGGIPTELPSVPTCSIFCEIISLSENGNPSVGLPHPGKGEGFSNSPTFANLDPNPIKFQEWTLLGREVHEGLITLERPEVKTSEWVSLSEEKLWNSLWTK